MSDSRLERLDPPDLLYIVALAQPTALTAAKQLLTK